ncbi:hypothetical protein TELCIR_03044 [Teladorsagia circumcincta]|uniref:Uncharacterized protein n=1 Tax=Teladorsagia circumcincta TaxID=45464 RepID=A0A2G9UXH3_TELCI|nr:hypothetical protein TELCIR_03044 [Teladorsagia circumcincta]
MMSPRTSTGRSPRTWKRWPPRKAGCSPKFTNKPRTRAPTGPNANPWQRWLSLITIP